MEFMDDSILVLIPVFNDWKSLSMLLAQIEDVFKTRQLKVRILIVDDASSVPPWEGLLPKDPQVIQRIDILELKRNLGHQRAIAIGLAYAETHIQSLAVIVMDGDGEDTPSDMLRLIDKCKEEGYQKIIFARRTQRSESRVFKSFYVVYKLLYKILTGQDIRVGNFSIIPNQALHRLVVVSEVWNHYAAGILKSRIPCTEIPSSRGTRLYGTSKMNFVSLVTHGLSAISVYGDIVGTRLLVASCLLILFDVLTMATVLTIRLTTNLAIPGWTSYIAILLFIILVQAVMLSLVFIFVVLNGRNSSSFLPQRDYHYFILQNQKFFP